MNASELIREVEEKCSEYLEMTRNPSAFIAEVLANKVIKMQFQIEYLERRLNYDSPNSARSSSRK